MRVVEHVGVLGDDADLVSCNDGQRQVSSRRDPPADRAAADVVQPRHEGVIVVLPAPGRTDERDQLTGLDPEDDAVQYLAAPR